MSEEKKDIDLTLIPEWPEGWEIVTGNGEQYLALVRDIEPDYLVLHPAYDYVSQTAITADSKGGMDFKIRRETAPIDGMASEPTVRIPKVSANRRKITDYSEADRITFAGIIIGAMRAQDHLRERQQKVQVATRIPPNLRDVNRGRPRH